jgi:hypothetical protein
LKLLHQAGGGAPEAAGIVVVSRRVGQLAIFRWEADEALHVLVLISANAAVLEVEPVLLFPTP